MKIENYLWNNISKLIQMYIALKLHFSKSNENNHRTYTVLYIVQHQFIITSFQQDNLIDDACFSKNRVNIQRCVTWSKI